MPLEAGQGGPSGLGALNQDKEKNGAEPCQVIDGLRDKESKGANPHQARGSLKDKGNKGIAPYRSWIA